MEKNLITKNELDSILIGYVPKRYLTQKEAVRYTGTSAGTLNDWIKKGLRIIIFEENSRPKYDVKDIDEFMEKHKTK
ncbi:helix-turn-helix domain-containing protein [Enterococcus mundtii]|uniref:helix-turn-helix domain-containing protein n=1 Tax=Enterococcus mundtii TaxID=53346 RepID=UPI00115B6A17|nr:helix-turn-helix domain-containing protein [Enterococcus mundtii]